MPPIENVVLWNGTAGSANQAEAVRQELESQPGFTIHDTSSREEARRLAGEAARRGVGRVVAAGGDGTVNAVINGLYQNGSRPVLGILPLGTGNDLCRTLGIPLDPVEAVRLILSDTNPPRPIDLVRVDNGATSAVFANVCGGGNSQRVAERMTDETKRFWGVWSYLRGAIDVLSDLQGFDVTMRLDDGPLENVCLWNVILANGKTSAGGLVVAPQADVEDGLLDVVLIQDGTPLDVAALSMEFVLGDYLQDDRVIVRRARRAEFRSDPPMQFVADGETVGTTPVTFVIEHHALRVTSNIVSAPDATIL